MPITKLTIDQFTAFKHAEFNLSPGVNVLVGENGTGKSHALNLLYVFYEAIRRSRDYAVGVPEVNSEFKRYLTEIFRPDALGRLVRRGPRPTKPTTKARVEVTATGGSARIELVSAGKLTFELQHTSPAAGEAPTLAAVLVPATEVLTMYPGFIASWRARDFAFDRRYYDLCKKLERLPLARPLDRQRKAILAPLEAALGGEVVMQRRHFIVRTKNGDVEVTLLAEGLRKIAAIACMVGNGTLSQGSVLLWDLPAASMSPAMAPLLAQTAFALADQGVQVVITAHEGALSNELSLEAERRRKKENDVRPPAAFFGILSGVVT